MHKNAPQFIAKMITKLQTLSFHGLISEQEIMPILFEKVEMEVNINEITPSRKNGKTITKKVKQNLLFSLARNGQLNNTIRQVIKELPLLPTLKIRKAFIKQLLENFRIPQKPGTEAISTLNKEAPLEFINTLIILKNASVLNNQDIKKLFQEKEAAYFFSYLIATDKPEKPLNTKKTISKLLKNNLLAKKDIQDIFQKLGLYELINTYQVFRNIHAFDMAEIHLAGEDTALNLIDLIKNNFLHKETVRKIVLHKDSKGNNILHQDISFNISNLFFFIEDNINILNKEDILNLFFAINKAGKRTNHQMPFQAINLVMSCLFWNLSITPSNIKQAINRAKAHPKIKEEIIGRLNNILSGYKNWYYNKLAEQYLPTKGTIIYLAFLGSSLFLGINGLKSFFK